jgi:hypothetical protein
MYVLDELQPTREKSMISMNKATHGGTFRKGRGQGAGSCKLAHDWLAGWNKQAARCSTLQELAVCKKKRKNSYV